MKVKAVTILLTSYNSEKYIESTLKSVINQIHKDFELLIIDDGSTDNTCKIIESIEDDRIKLVKLNHRGRSAVLNYGLESAVNDWVAIIDSDDLWHHQKLKIQLSKDFCSENIVSLCNATYFKENQILFKNTNPDSQQKLIKILALHGHICHSSVIFNRKKILEIGGYNTNLLNSVDYDLWLRIKETFHFSFNEEYLVYVRQHKNSLSRKDMEKTNNIIYNLQKPYYEDLETSFPMLTYNEKVLKRGWREYFYGNKRKARKLWSNKAICFIIDPRVLIAYFLTFLPDNFSFYLKEIKLKLRIKYLLGYFTSTSIRIRNDFKYLLNTIA